MNKHGVSRMWFTKVGVNYFKSVALRITTDVTRTGFELRVSPSQNAIYFSITVIPKKFYFTILAMQDFVQNTKKHVNSVYNVGIMFVR